MEISVLEASGLITDPNQLSSVPPSALKSCTNVDCDRINTYQKTRGFKDYATLTGVVKKFFSYQGKTLVYYLNGVTPTLAYDNNGTFVNYGAITSTYPMFSTSANSNFYFTTDNGVKKLDSVTGSILSSGVPQGLGGTYTLIATTANILANNQKTAYRVVWGYTDANNNLILGAPSPRIPVVNTSGSTKDVQLVLQIPDEITSTKYFYQVYRADAVVNTTEPIDEMYLVGQVTLNTTDLTNRFVTFTDRTSANDTGATIYTAPSQQGIENAYFQPPFAKDIGTFEGSTFYANTKTKQIILSQLTKVQSTGFGYFTITGDITNTQFVMINVPSTTNVQIGQAITGSGIPANTTVLGKTSTTVTLSNAATITATGATFTIRDFIQVGSEIYYASDVNDNVNRYFNVNTDLESATINFTNLVNAISVSYNAYYLGIGDVEKGKFEIEALSFSTPQFTLTGSQGSAFIGNLPQSSQNESVGNRLYLSLPNQPEAVPFGNYIDIGSSEFFIERILFLRDSFFIFTSDGSLWKGVGSTIDTISVRLYNSNAKLRGIQLPAILDNNIFCFSDQGVLVINENGIEIISDNIKTDLFKISKVRNSTFESVSFGIGYETDRKYIMFMNELSTDTLAKQAFVFNTLTKAWTRWKRDANYAFWNRDEDRLYTGTSIVRQERKDYAVTDFCETELDVSIITVSGVTVTLSSVSGIQVGWSLYQNGLKSKILEINGTTLTLSLSLGFVAGSAKVCQPVEFSFSYLPQAYGALMKSKAHKELFHYVQNVNFESFDQTISNEDQSSPDTDSIVPKSTALPVQYLRTFLPKNQTRSNWLNITISQSEACTNFEYLGYVLSGDVISDRSK